MNLPSMQQFAAAAVTPQQAEQPAKPSLVMGLAGAAAGAIVAALIYGVVGRFIGEMSYLAVLVGIASGAGATTLGKGNSIPVGIAAAIFTLVSMIVGKLVVGAPPGVSWIAYHTTMFDILFCYLLAPLAALGLGGVPQLGRLFSSLRGRFGV